jgi:hypothetical protein
MKYTIQLREFNILGGCGHYYWAMFNSNGRLVAEMHGLATRRIWGQGEYGVKENMGSRRIWGHKENMGSSL